LCAEAWSQLGETKNALAEQRRAAELPEDQPWPDPFYEKIPMLRRGLRARFLSTDYLLENHRIPEALQLLTQTLEKYPSSLEGWMRLGEVWHRAKELERAQACYQQAARLAPNFAEVWFRLGCIQSQIHSPDAVKSFRETIRWKPHYAQAHYNLGLYLKEQDQRAAAGEFREALRCRPDFDLAQKALRDLEAQQGKKQ
jgi:tetratricopeptide (TPR) repeat protein